MRERSRFVMDNEGNLVLMRTDGSAGGINQSAQPLTREEVHRLCRLIERNNAWEKVGYTGVVPRSPNGRDLGVEEFNEMWCLILQLGLTKDA